MNKNFIYVIAVLLFTITSCSKDKEVIQIAEDYTSKNICTLFDDAILVKKKASTEVEVSIIYIENKEQKLDYIADATMANFKAINSRGTYYLTQVGTTAYETKAKNFQTADATNYFSQQALQEGNEQEGFYVVTYTIEFGEEFDDQVTFNVVLSKDLKVLNKSVDINAYKKHLEEANK